MGLFSKQRGMSIIGTRVPKGRTIRVQKTQTGKIGDIKRDAGRKAKAPGKRISASGNIYWESRKNRSDKVGKRL